MVMKIGGLDRVLTIPDTIHVQSNTVVASGGFVPTDITGLQLWLDANDISTLWTDSGRTTQVASDADPVGAWDDKSGNSEHFLQSTSAQRPTYKTGIQNGLPVIRFDGTDDWFQNTTISVASGDFTFFFAVDSTKATTDLTYYMDAQTGRLILAQLANSSANIGYYDGAWQQIAAATTGAQLIEFEFNGGGEIFRDTSSIGTGTYSAKAIGGDVGLGNAYNSPGTNIFGDIFEVLIYDTALGASDQGDVRTYLNDKWAIY